MNYQFESPLSAFNRFVISGLLVVGLHVAVIGAFLWTSENLEEALTEDGGVVFIELSSLDVSTELVMLDLPAGPQAQETPAVVDSPEEIEVNKAVDGPVLNRTHYEPDDPDLRFSVANPDQEENDSEIEADAPPTKVQEQKQTVATPAVDETTAPPTVKAKKSDKSAATDEGISESLKRSIDRWQKRLMVHLYKHKRYPRKARNRRIQGTIELWFKMDKYGRILDKRIISGGGKTLLANAALNILKRAGKLPAPPNKMPGETFEFTIPVDFLIRK